MKMNMNLQRLRQEVDRLRDGRSADDLSDIEIRGGVEQFSVRYLGDWEVPADEEDDGDYDWKVPTTATRARLDTLVKKYPGTAWENEGEKCWLRFYSK